jgi:hypothetical protein
MSGLLAGNSLREFFKGMLGKAIEHQRIELAEVTEFYLVNLLTEFAFAEKMAGDEPLAILYHRALQQEREERIRLLRRLGDVSLYKAGFFAESLRHDAVGPDYYIQMGGNAYGQVADLSKQTSFASVYRELCEKFRAVVDVLEEIAARGLVANGPQGTLRVYETWTRTRSDRLEKVLVDAGVLPIKDGGLPN